MDWVESNLVGKNRATVKRESDLFINNTDSDKIG